MKKVLCLLAAAVLLCVMTGCTFNAHFSDSTGIAKMQSAPKVETLLEALADEDPDNEFAYIHPEAEEKSEAALAQLKQFLAGRDVRALEQQSASVNTSSGTNGNSRMEKGVFLVTLEDQTTFYISATHLTNSEGEGFASFQFVLGLV